MRIAVMTDSTAYIPAAVREANDIHMVPLSVVFGNHTYQEEVDITTEEFYKKVEQSDQLPKTTQPAIGLIVDKLEQLAKEYDAVISIHLSSGISGTYQTVVSAGKMVEGINVYPYDSEISAMAQGFYVLEASRLATEGELSPEKIIARLDEMKQSVRAYFLVDDLSNLHRGGRLNGAQALIGSVLQVKPLLHFVDKQIVPFEKIRTKKKALKRIYDLFEEDAQKGKLMKACVIHANSPKEAEEMKVELEQLYNHVDVSISYFGPVIGTHLGEGALGLAWYVE
ncbi:DegV family protein [Radiobacillus kanasensis]|uniref:DegV family protein n=1 Tax=Radiobacillus kanasensis TaxID=2844358 RepID=UPI001E3C2494|nr:DegV family protein [Radiobacillus kanasensis]UFT98559.1 DegV family protein [Radiobacillus kanasensis]